MKPNHSTLLTADAGEKRASSWTKREDCGFLEILRRGLQDDHEKIKTPCEGKRGGGWVVVQCLLLHLRDLQIDRQMEGQGGFEFT